jgi:hypothetical protein
MVVVSNSANPGNLSGVMLQHWFTSCPQCASGLGYLPVNRFTHVLHLGLRSAQWATNHFDKWSQASLSTAYSIAFMEC